MCNCNRPKKLYKSFKYSGGDFEFPKKCFLDGNCVDIVLCQNLCGEDEEQIITFSFDGVKYVVFNKYGNAAKIKDVCPRTLYHCWFSTENAPGQFVITNSRCRG